MEFVVRYGSLINDNACSVCKSKRIIKVKTVGNS